MFWLRGLLEANGIDTRWRGHISSLVDSPERSVDWLFWCIRDVGRLGWHRRHGHGRHRHRWHWRYWCTRERRGRGGRGLDLLDVVGGKEALSSATFSRPPVRVGLVNNFDDFLSGKRKIVRFLWVGLSDRRRADCLWTYLSVLVVRPQSPCLVLHTRRRRRNAASRGGGEGHRLHTVDQSSIVVRSSQAGCHVSGVHCRDVIMGSEE